MKKSILLILIVIFSILSVKSQTLPNYPYFLKNNVGDTIGVVFSLAQAQRIDNDYELLSLLRKAKIQSDKNDSLSIVVVNELNEKVATLNLKVSALNDIDKLKDSEITNLKAQIELYRRDQSLSNTESAKKDTIINNDKREIRGLKTQRFLGFVIGGTALIYLLIHK